MADLVLAEGSGIGVVRRARQLGTKGKVVVLTGYASPGIRRHLLDLGAHRVFDKAEHAEFVKWLNEVPARTAGRGA